LKFAKKSRNLYNNFGGYCIFSRKTIHKNKRYDSGSKNQNYSGVVTIHTQAEMFPDPYLRPKVKVAKPKEK
jgi:hypothetical protein